jgi:hypothetical protein
MTSSRGDRLTVEVRTSGQMALDQSPSYSGSFGHPLIPGLPDEFGAAVMAGLLGEAENAGTLVVDRAAYDLVESSSASFRTAAILLAVVLNLDPSDNAEASVRTKLEELSVS